ncbi:MAG: hypothetical protein CME08_02490 [Gemmatimonadetes bacterium]|nr:hypothetical protein [Gemmatimonadota bacterium]MEC9298127.1 hypothetical protein [Gemmatimonadota bacterium]MED5199382.1 hypothetical protein [Gemmatimonadota bacterium]
MRETLEEFASRHIDGLCLYHGALFLTGGEEPLAEDLVLWTLTGDIKRMEGADCSEVRHAL